MYLVPPPCYASYLWRLEVRAGGDLTFDHGTLGGLMGQVKVLVFDLKSSLSLTSPQGMTSTCLVSASLDELCTRGCGYKHGNGSRARLSYEEYAKEMDHNHRPCLTLGLVLGRITLPLLLCVPHLTPESSVVQSGLCPGIQRADPMQF